MATAPFDFRDLVQAEHFDNGSIQAKKVILTGSGWLFVNGY